MFFNMYVHAAPNYAPGFMKSDILHGAYMTDFVKFVEEDGEYIPAGIPDSNSTSKTITKCLSKDRIAIQAKGLKEELDLLGIKPKVIILVGSRLDRVGIRRAIENELGYKPHFEKLYHYTPRGVSYKKMGFNSYKDMYSSLISQVSKNIKSKI